MPPLLLVNKVWYEIVAVHLSAAGDIMVTYVAQKTNLPEEGSVRYIAVTVNIANLVLISKK